MQELTSLESSAYFAMFQTMVDAAIITNDKGDILYANPATVKLFQYSIEELTGNSIKQLMPIYHSEKHDEYMHSYKVSHQKKVIGKGRKVMAKSKDGDLVTCWLSLSEFTHQTRVYFAGILTDIRKLEQKDHELITLNNTLELTIKQKTKELKEALKKSKELNQLKSKFLTFASHEFKTPLSTILSSAILIEKHAEQLNNLSKNQEKHVDRIKRSVGVLTSIIEDFFSVERAEQNNIKTNWTSFFPEELIQEAITLIQVQKPKEQVIHISLPDEAEKIVSDYQLCLQVLLNLLSNAIKYSSPEKPIFIEYHIHEYEVEFKVIDQGRGISEQNQKHIFEQFYRADNVQAAKGTGIGLHLSKKYAHLLGGDLGFSSILNQGSCFIFTIPKRPISDE